MRLAPLMLLGASLASACSRGCADDGPVAPPLVVEPTQPLKRKPKLAMWGSARGVVRSGPPIIIVYADGSAIANRHGLVEGRVADVSTLTAALSKQLLPLAKHENITGETDQRTTTILLETERGWIVRSVYGLSGCRPVEDARRPRAGFVSACQTLSELTLGNDRVYQPETLEVMLSGYDYPPETTKPWPDTLPAPPKVAPPKSGEVKHLIPGRYQSELEAFLSSRGSRQAVSFNDFNWSVSFRVVLPADEYLDQVLHELRWHVRDTLDAGQR